jgi:hypothetical protein
MTAHLADVGLNLFHNSPRYLFSQYLKRRKKRVELIAQPFLRQVLTHLILLAVAA